jgi:hypothetical protein
MDVRSWQSVYAERRCCGHLPIPNIEWRTPREKTHVEQVAACAIAFGLWANVWVTLVRPTQAQTTRDPLTDLSHTLSFIQTDLHKLMDGTCSNRKICTPR